MTAKTPEARRAAVQRAYAASCIAAQAKLTDITDDAFRIFDTELVEAQSTRDAALALIPDGQPAVDSTTEGTPQP